MYKNNIGNVFLRDNLNNPFKKQFETKFLEWSKRPEHHSNFRYQFESFEMMRMREQLDIAYAIYLTHPKFFVTLTFPDDYRLSDEQAIDHLNKLLLHINRELFGRNSKEHLYGYAVIEHDFDKPHFHLAIGNNLEFDQLRRLFIKKMRNMKCFMSEGFDIKKITEIDDDRMVVSCYLVKQVSTAYQLTKFGLDAKNLPFDA